MANVLHALRGAARSRGAVGHAVRLLRALLVVATIGLMQCSSTPDGPIVVGVLLPMSGPTSFGSLTGRRALELAQANLAAGGAVGGRAIELRFVDIAQVDPAVAAKAMADDGDVVAVIGPDTSTAAFAVGPIFDAAQKPLVVPSASSADFGRAFAGRRTMWRTIESDIAQTRVLLELAAKNGAHKVALLTSFEPYGETFFDWFAFYATELGLEVTASERSALSAASCADDVRRVAATSPDAMLIVPSTPAGLTCTALAHADLAVRPRLYYPDIGRDPALIAALGARAEGIEGTAPAASSDSGFLEAWRARYAEDLPPTYAASTYDALLLLGYGLTSSGGRGGQALIDALERVVTGRGETVRADAAGVARALELLRNNASPNVLGASSRLDYDSVGFTDLTSSTYGLWRVQGQAFIRPATVDTGGDGPGSERAIFATVGGAAAQQQLADNPSLVVGPKKGLWALIVAASVGWPNYRHQADALAQYQVLRANGVADDHIVLVAQDDIATDAANAIKGTVRNVAGGPNVREPAVIDYRVGDLAASDLSDILLGRARADLPTVLQSGPDDDVYVFLVGHGNGSGLYLRADSPSFVATPRDLFAPSMLGLAIRTLAQRAGYRRMLVAVEMCNGGVMGAALGDDTPRAALLSGAAPFEDSFAANYDFALKQWVADQFAFALWDVSSHTPDVDLRRAFGALYARVPGSHVKMYNTQNFGVLASVALGDFFRP